MLPAGTYTREYRDDTAVIRTRLQWGLLVGFLAFLFAFPLFASRSLVSLVTLISMDLLAVLGLYVVMGLCGQISLAAVAFMAAGAYAEGILVASVGLPFWLALPLAGLTASLVALLFGTACLRVKGFYLILASIAAHFIVLYAIVHLPSSLTGGPNGFAVPRLSLGSLVLDSVERFYWFVMVVVVIATWIALNIRRTKAGRAFIAVRDNDIAAEVLGIDIFKYKLLAFTISGFYAGVAGALLGHYMEWIVPDQFTFMKAIWLVGMLVVGGAGSVVGAILGTGFIHLLDNLSISGASVIGSVFPSLSKTAAGSIGLIAFGLVLALFLLFEPRGLTHLWHRIRAYYRLWPFARSG